MKLAGPIVDLFAVGLAVMPFSYSVDRRILTDCAEDARNRLTGSAVLLALAAVGTVIGLRIMDRPKSEEVPARH